MERDRKLFLVISPMGGREACMTPLSSLMGAWAASSDFLPLLPAHGPPTAS
jgi:hypothetical protein